MKLFSRQAGKDDLNREKRGAYATHLIDAYGNAVLRLAYSYLHNMEDAEDILQETVIKMLDVDVDFENDAHEKSYVLKTASNMAKNRIVYNKYRETDELMDDLVSDEKEDLSFVWEAVKSLPENFREVIHLFYAEGYKTAEIAEVLGRNESTVRSDLKRGREKLKEILKEEYDFE